jgi:hypothetical protein
MNKAIKQHFDKRKRIVEGKFRPCHKWVPGRLSSLVNPNNGLITENYYRQMLLHFGGY